MDKVKTATILLIVLIVMVAVLIVAQFLNKQSVKNADGTTSVVKNHFMGMGMKKLSAPAKDKPATA